MIDQDTIEYRKQQFKTLYLTSDYVTQYKVKFYCEEGSTKILNITENEMLDIAVVLLGVNE